MNLKREMLNSSNVVSVKQGMPTPIWNMELGTIFTRHKSGYNPQTDALEIYIKVSKIKCLELTTGSRHSIPKLFGWNGTGYPILLPWSSILSVLHSHSLQE